jgi:MPBQ/MSBQ methyltransferase
VPALPPYFDALIAARRAGQVGRHVHLGYWDDPPALTVPPRDGEFEAAQARLTERLIDLAQPAFGQTVLDVACGFGGTLAAIDARLAGMRLTGLNIDRRQLALCRGAVTGPANSLTLVAADACALPFPSAAFDRVLCVEAMFHFASRQRFLAEAARVLCPGGCLVMSDILLHRPASGAPWDAGTISAIVRRDYGPWPAPWATISDILSWADEARLERISLHDWSAATLPSYRTVAPEKWGATRRRSSAGDVFRWLQVNGSLTYPAFSFRRR